MAANSCNDLEEAETSLVPVMTDGTTVVGYDCDFIEPPPDDLLCKICHYPARDPVLAVCCGNNFCKSCLELYHQSNIINCPHCHAENCQSMPDKRTERYVFNLKVFCHHKCQGCNWIGEMQMLGDHINQNSNNNIGCPFTELWCSNGCGVMIQRRLIEGHLKSECELRKVKCEYCNTTGNYQWISSSHQEECLGYPVECPNHCEIGHVRREEMSGHLEECPLAIVECPYVAVGCESVVRRKEQMEHVMRSMGQHMEYNKNTILGTQNELERIKEELQNTCDKLHAREKELQNTKEDLQTIIYRVEVKEKELENIKRDLEATRDRMDTKEQAMVSINKELQDTKDQLKVSQGNQSQLRAIITEKGKELDEIRKNAAKNNRMTHVMIQQLKDKLERFEQSHQYQLKVNAQLQLQINAIFNSNWSLRLNFLANNNKIVPVVIKLAEFEEYKKTNSCLYSTGFYTRDGGYKMCLVLCPNGRSYGSDDHIAVGACMMKGDHDHHLAWPVRGTLTVQLLNQLKDCNHSEATQFHFDGCSKNCHKVQIVSHHAVWNNQLMPHKRLSYDAERNCQYLMSDCVFLRVCNFQ